MKVTMDACVFGAWVPLPLGTSRVLDIGIGTGLLSLMLAQRFPTIEIDAVEIDEEAAAQASENIAASPFADRIRVIHMDARTMSFPRKYDAVVSNPPFFNGSFQGVNSRRMNARHTNTLDMDDLMRICANSLQDDGHIAVLWPAIEHATWRKRAEAKGYYLRREVCILPTENAPHTRTASMYTRGIRAAGTADDEALVMVKNDGTYTSQFADLLRPFYLKL